jgi:hypothetical protein
MSPVVSPGDHMFKMCFHPSSSSEEARWLPGQASTIGRKLLSQQEEEDGGQGTQVAGKGFADHNTSYSVLLASSSQQEVQEAEVAADADSVPGTAAAQDAQRIIGAHAQHGEIHLPDQLAVNSAYLAAHPTKDAAKSGLATALQQHWPQQVPASSNTSVGSRPNIGSDAIGDRIGRVALANEHRKVIRQELSPKKELSCPHYLVYVGTSGQLMQALEVSDFVPKSSWIPLQWPHMIEQLLVYTFAVSGALALINMAPIWYLDGESALSSAIRLRSHSDLFYSSVTQPSRHWGRLLRCILGVGSCVFVCVFLLHMVRLLGYDAKLGHLLHTLGKLLSFVLT